MGVILVDEVEGGSTADMVVVFCLDETGSMQRVKDATVKGYNEYVETLQNEKGNVKFSLIRFNECTGARIAIDSVPIQDVKPLNDYDPRCNTPLFDTVGRAIGIGSNNDDGKVKILIVIQTDGEENCSKEYKDVSKLREMIKEKEKQGNWTVVCLGADMDAWDKIGSAMGLSRGNVIGYCSTNTVGAFHDVACATRTYGASTTRSTKNFFDSSYTANTGGD